MTLTIPGSYSFLLNKVAGAAYDGVYDGLGQGRPGTDFVPLRTSIISNTFISYNLGEFVSIFIGTIMTDAGSCLLTYAYSAASSEIPPNTVIAADFAVIGTPPNNEIIINSTSSDLPFLAELIGRSKASDIDGTWIGLTPPGNTTVELTYGVFRSYTMAAESNLGYLGSFDTNSTHIELTYGYTQPASDEQGRWFSIPYELSPDGNTLTLNGNIVLTRA
jgi:hypothetical protein